jgi:hypothetical protein
MYARVGLALSAILAGVLIGDGCNAAEMVASFFDMSDSKFSVKAVAPKQSVREYAICKAVWFAEKKKVAHIALSNPVYGPPSAPINVPGGFPGDWVSIVTTAYFETVSPEGNPTFLVANKADQCRKGWSWYR